MGLMLPKLTREVDCEPLGYPGIVLTLWLNVPDAEWKVPENAQPWDKYAYWHTARIVDRVFVPAKYDEGGEDATLELADQKAVYELMKETPGFDSYILVWAVNAWNQKRAEWLSSEVKN